VTLTGRITVLGTIAIIGQRYLPHVDASHPRFSLTLANETDVLYSLDLRRVRRAIFESDRAN